MPFVNDIHPVFKREYMIGNIKHIQYTYLFHCDLADRSCRDRLLIVIALSTESSEVRDCLYYPALQDRVRAGFSDSRGGIDARKTTE